MRACLCCPCDLVFQTVFEIIFLLFFFSRLVTVSVFFINVHVRINACVCVCVCVCVCT